MSTRTTTQIVTFKRPFRVRRTDRELQAGDYQIETDEEPIDGLPTLSYRRVEVRLFVPRRDGVSEAEMWVMGAREFDAALLTDQAAPEPPVLDSGRDTESRPVFPRAETYKRPDQQKGANTPLYGTLLGVLAVLIAGAVLGRMDLARQSAQESPTQVTDTRD